MTKIHNAVVAFCSYYCSLDNLFIVIRNSCRFFVLDIDNKLHLSTQSSANFILPHKSSRFLLLFVFPTKHNIHWKFHNDIVTREDSSPVLLILQILQIKNTTSASRQHQLSQNKATYRTPTAKMCVIRVLTHLRCAGTDRTIVQCNGTDCKTNLGVEMTHPDFYIHISGIHTAEVGDHCRYCRFETCAFRIPHFSQSFRNTYGGQPRKA